MTGDTGKIDQWLASALRGESAAWPTEPRDDDFAADVQERISYHGIAGLIAAEARRFDDWPPQFLASVHEQGVALAMWELRHKEILGQLLAALSEANITTLLLKGTALAYDLYPAPATRARGDSDLLLAPSDVDDARRILLGLGYRCLPFNEAIADDLALQEVWTLACDAGTTHHIDLHWQLINAPALRGVLPFSACAAGPLALKRLAPTALAMSRVNSLLHTCIHRAMHLTSPYFVNGVTYYGGDRLIWARDIDLLAGALSDEEWRQLNSAALERGVARVCLDGLKTARRLLGTEIPGPVRRALARAGKEPASDYLLESGQARRAWRDLAAIRGWTRKLAYLRSRALPNADFIRAKYPHSRRSPLPLLHLRRVIGLILPRHHRKPSE